MQKTNFLSLFIMKNRIIYIIISLMLVFWNGCKEEGRIDHIDDRAPAPAQVSDVRVFPTYGGAVLKYTLPNDQNLLYVKAVYEIQPGVIHETKASYFKDSLVLEGFGDTKTYDVQIFSVGKNEKASEPLVKQVNPLTPPVRLATKQLREAFGGVAIDVENPTRANLTIVLLADTAKLGYLTELYTFWTSAQKGVFSYRGLDSIPYDFAVYFRDRWDNFSDTVKANVTPWFEEFIHKNTWAEYPMSGDASPLNANYPVRMIWNGITTGATANSGYHSMDLPLPQIITWDLGVTAKLGRFKFWPRDHQDDRWARGHPKIFELYGSLTRPDQTDGSLDNWIPLGRFECVKPSGPGLQVTQEDIEFGAAGIDFDFEPSDFAPDPITPIRYLRFRTLTVFGNTTVTPVNIAEISFWGSIIK